MTKRTPRTTRRDEHGQALAIVLGIVGLLIASTLAVVQAALGGGPLLNRAVLADQAHEAVLSGINEYLAAVNTNPDEVVCNSSNDQSGLCSAGPQFQTWQALRDTAQNAVPTWYWLSDPQVDPSTGLVDLTVVGAAGDPASKTTVYEQAQISLRSTNSFLQDVQWSNYDQTDPYLLAPGASSADPGPTCGIYWQDYAVNEWTGQVVSKAVNSIGPSGNCSALVDTTGYSINGPVFSNDAVFVCGSPTFTVVHTKDPYMAPGQFTVVAPGCPSGNPTILDPSESTSGANTPNESPPPTNQQLIQVAERLGCVYQGPTELTFSTTSSGTVMAVTSPDTPTLGNTSGPNDALNSQSNPNACMPSQEGGTVSVPANGVVYVQNCPANDSSCTFDPLQNAGEPDYAGPSEGDAIVHGTVGSPLTVAAANNVVIDENLCYYSTSTSCPTSSNQVSNLPGQPPPILGLIAQNFVVLNHPVVFDSQTDQYQNEPICGTSGAYPPPDCDLENPVVDAVALALNHSFAVANYTQGQPLGTMSVLGSIEGEWTDVEGTYNFDSNGNPYLSSGYNVDYNYDTRLATNAPPYYLNPGTPSWALASITLNSTLGCEAGGCTPAPSSS
jgi:hypothetical protein